MRKELMCRTTPLARVVHQTCKTTSTHNISVVRQTLSSAHTYYEIKQRGSSPTRNQLCEFCEEVGAEGVQLRSAQGLGQRVS
jgi:hypothetical protein